MLCSSWLVLFGMLFFPSLWQRLRSGDCWPLLNLPSDFNSVSMFVSSSLGPGSEGPGKSIPSSSSVWFILKQDSGFGSLVVSVVSQER